MFQNGGMRPTGWQPPYGIGWVGTLMPGGTRIRRINRMVRPECETVLRLADGRRIEQASRLIFRFPARHGEAPRLSQHDLSEVFLRHAWLFLFPAGFVGTAEWWIPPCRSSMEQPTSFHIAQAQNTEHKTKQPGKTSRGLPLLPNGSDAGKIPLYGDFRHLQPVRGALFPFIPPYLPRSILCRVYLSGSSRRPHIAGRERGKCGAQPIKRRQ